MRSSRTEHGPHSRGFVLVGVVMFVLALTILGISLFGLSSYEAQFYGRSSDSAQAFYSALSGIESARFAITQLGTLDAVKTGLPIGDIVYVRACRVNRLYTSSDTSGSVPWGEPIQIRALANHNGERRMVEQTFIPHQPKPVYRQLITAYDGLLLVHFENQDPTHNRLPQTIIDGKVSQGSTDSSWIALQGLGLVLGPGVVPPVYSTDVVLPDVANYRALHLSGATPYPPAGSAGNNHLYNFTGGSGTTTFYETSGLNGLAPTNNQYSVMDFGGQAAKINVSGTAIWMLEHGMWTDQTVTVNGTATDLLVIVAQAPVGSNPDNAAVYFQGGLDSPNVPVILVTDGAVDIEALSALATTTDACLSIYCDKVLLGGPPAGYLAKFLRPSVPQPIDPTIDALTGAGLLPNSGGQTVIPPVRRTWHELDPNNPPS